MQADQDRGRIPFEKLTNPVLGYPDWSIKDFACAYYEGTYHLFFSAFYADRGMIRSHVVQVCTADFTAYSEPLLHFDGTEEGWLGMCSPEIMEADGEFILSFNSWGDLEGRPNQLFCKRSKDLRRWSEGYLPLAPELTRGNRAIDAAMAYSAGRYIVFWKERTDRDRTRMATAARLEGPYTAMENGQVELIMADGQDNGRIHENFCFLRQSEGWLLVTTDYRPHEIFVYSMSGRGEQAEDWLKWKKGRRLEIPGQSWNTSHLANAAALYDWRAQTGYYYILYAGNAENETFAKRGHNRLGLARSLDLLSWEVCGDDTDENRKQ
ncbi:hypothetical protein [Paenibacillus sp. 1P07SE]|uniref:hypothetical protein n=1 Tax=Paenibacillus sp. 1P07SE TaxID=3132209 RepID=UPI0039A51573